MMFSNSFTRFFQHVTGYINKSVMQSWSKPLLSGAGGEDFHMKWSGMLVGKFELHP